MSTLAGLIHVRRLPSAGIAFALACIAVVVFYDLIIDVSVKPFNQARGLGAVELIGALLALCLAVLTPPVFNGRERLGASLPRLTHTAISIMLMAAPLLLLPIWRAAVEHSLPEQYLPAISLLAGNLLMASAISTAFVLLLGRIIGALASILYYGAFVTAQQVWPDGPLATHFSAGTTWHTDWPFTATLLIIVSAIVYATSSVPRDIH